MPSLPSAHPVRDGRGPELMDLAPSTYDGGCRCLNVQGDENDQILYAEWLRGTPGALNGDPVGIIYFGQRDSESC
jgi:hypothetical protein